MIPLIVTAVRTSPLTVHSFVPVFCRNSLHSATLSCATYCIRGHNRNRRMLVFEYEYRILYASRINSHFKTFLSDDCRNTKFHCYSEARQTSSVFSANSERMWYELGPGYLNSWRHLQSMVADQVGEEVTLRRSALRAWVANVAALLTFAYPAPSNDGCTPSSECSEWLLS
jgi:hypothetical protein